MIVRAFPICLALSSALFLTGCGTSYDKEAILAQTMEAKDQFGSRTKEFLDAVQNEQFDYVQMYICVAEMRTPTEKDKLQKLAGLLRDHLGPLQPLGNPAMTIENQGAVRVANTQYTAQFERGTAEIIAEWVSSGDQWLGRHFQIDSDQFPNEAQATHRPVEVYLTHSELFLPGQSVDVVDTKSDPPAVLAEGVLVNNVRWKVGEPGPGSTGFVTLVVPRKLARKVSKADVILRKHVGEAEPETDK
ncbi:MAG: hypothetical protein R3E96_17545 [Planctomycetota bacterium]